MTSGPLLNVGVLFEGYRITKAVPTNGDASDSSIQSFKATRASELRIDAVRTIYCMRPTLEESASEVVEEFAKRLERLKALRLPERPEVEAGGFAAGILWVAVHDTRGTRSKT